MVVGSGGGRWRCLLSLLQVLAPCKATKIHVIKRLLVGRAGKGKWWWWCRSWCRSCRMYAILHGALYRISGTCYLVLNSWYQVPNLPGTESMVFNIGYRIGTLYQIYRTDYNTKLSVPSVYRTLYWYLVS